MIWGEKNRLCCVVKLNLSTEPNEKCVTGLLTCWVQFNFIYIVHLKNIVDQSASQCPEKLPHKQNEYSKNATMSRLNSK